MTHLLKHKLSAILKWGSLNFLKNNLFSLEAPIWAIRSCHIVKNPRFCHKRREAQTALFEFLHSTRGLQYMDAENMSQNSPRFLDKLLSKFETEENIGESVAKFLRYYSINEFEPFFESLALVPSQYRSLLPQKHTLLEEDELLLQNYYVLCNYGIARNRIGKIYMEASEVFRYDLGILQERLKVFEEMGLNQSTVIKVVASSPCLLTGNVDREFCKFLEMLRTFGVEIDWIEGLLSEENSYNWSHMVEVFCLLSNMGCSHEQLRGLICQHPGLVFEHSGSTAISLIGFLLKFGATTSQIVSMFLQFPQLKVEKYVWNLRQCYQLFTQIDMDLPEIGRIVRAYPVLLGSCSLKKCASLFSGLNTGKKRICEAILENPQVLKKWVLGSRIEPLGPVENNILAEKAKFLLDSGFVNNHNEISEAGKKFHGKAGELQERFDCLVDAGLDRKDVLKMLKSAPQIINQTKDVIEMKIDFLVNGLGYPVSTLVSFPAYISFTIRRVNLRFSMYNWLVDQGNADPNLSLSCKIACPDGYFMKHYVRHHPRGPEIWEKFKKEIYSD